MGEGPILIKRSDGALIGRHNMMKADASPHALTIMGKRFVGASG